MVGFGEKMEKLFTKAAKHEGTLTDDIAKGALEGQNIVTDINLEESTIELIK